MTRLWDRGEPLDAQIERFTVGRDAELDLELVPHDALASMAHAIMLSELGILQTEDLPPLRLELRRIAGEARNGTFRIERRDEDGHTAIENRLTERLGETGKRIHTGRSRNDQVIAALRLWARERLLAQADAVLRVVDELDALAETHSETTLPGYSHTRQAMPTTFGHLLGCHAESLLDDLAWLFTAFRHVDRSPLGSASGFGVALPLDRGRVADLLGFASVQRNTLAVQNDRGKTEMLVLAAVSAFATDLARLAADLIFLSTDELACIRLSDDVTTGSSIMPQKRNPDVLELIRAGATRVRSRQAEAGAVLAGLGSGYHRDLQATKEPFLDGMRTAGDMAIAILPVLRGLEVDVERCRELLRPAIGATDAVYQEVAAGRPFRDAYKEVAADPEGAGSRSSADSWRARRHAGAPGDLDPGPRRGRRRQVGRELEALKQRVEGVWNLLEPQPSL